MFINTSNINIHNTSLLSTRDVLNFTYTEIISNGSNGFICHRFYEDQYFRNLSFSILFKELYLANVIWFGYDYKCYSSITPFTKEGRISKYSPMMTLIATLCIILMFWFPILTTQTERDTGNISKEQSNAHSPPDNNSTLNISKHDCFIYYKQGYIPYGLSRLFLILFRSKYEFGSQWKLLTYISYVKFFISIGAVFCVLYHYVEIYIHEHLPHDIENCEALTMAKIDVAKILVLLFSILILSFLLFSILILSSSSMSRKNYTYVFNFSDLMSCGSSSFLRKVPFKMLYRTKASVMANTFVNRFTSVFRPQFWSMVFALSIRTQRLKEQKIQRNRRCFPVL